MRIRDASDVEVEGRQGKRDLESDKGRGAKLYG
jgi:hypothetical protein